VSIRVGVFEVAIVAHPLYLFTGSYQGVLEGVRLTVAAGLSAASAIASFRLGGIVDVR